MGERIMTNNFEAKHTIVLNDYQVANLRELFKACGYHPHNPGDKRSPLWALQNGDWMGEIMWRLPDVDFAPNQTFEQMRDAVLRAVDSSS